MPSATFDAIPTVNTCAIAAKMVQRVKAIKAKTGETTNYCYKLAYLYTESLIYLGEPHDLEYRSVIVRHLVTDVTIDRKVSICDHCDI